MWSSTHGSDGSLIVHLTSCQKSYDPAKALKEAQDAERLRKTIENERLSILRREVADLEHAAWLKGAGAGADEAKRWTMRQVHTNDAFGNYGKLDPFREQLSLIRRRLVAQRKYEAGAFCVEAALTRAWTAGCWSCTLGAH